MIDSCDHLLIWINQNHNLDEWIVDVEEVCYIISFSSMFQISIS